MRLNNFGWGRDDVHSNQEISDPRCYDADVLQRWDDAPQTRHSPDIRPYRVIFLLLIHSVCPHPPIFKILAWRCYSNYSVKFLRYSRVLSLCSKTPCFVFILWPSRGVTMPHCAAWSSPLIIFSQLKFLLCWILVIYIIGSPQTMRALIVMIPSQKLDQRPINETKNSVKIFKFLLNNTIYFRVLPHFTIFTARDGRH